MDSHLKCPCCKRLECPICMYWNDDNIMDQLFSKNGARIYKHFDAQWLEILTHYFVYSGKVETTLHELYADLKRKGFIPISLGSCLLQFESRGYISIDRANSNTGFLSFFKNFFSSSEIPEDAAIRCDYLLRPAAEFASNELATRMDCSFFLIDVSDNLNRFLQKNPGLESDLDMVLISLHDAACQVIPEKDFQSSDFKNQGKLLLRHIQKDQEYRFACYCDSNGYGTFVAKRDANVLLIERIRNSRAHYTRFAITMMVTRLEKKAAYLEELRKKKRDEAKELMIAGQRDSAKIAVRESEKAKRNYESVRKEISSLQEKLKLLENTIEIGKLQNIHNDLADVLQRSRIDTDRLENMVDGLQNQQASVNEANELLLHMDHNQDDTTLNMMQELDASIINDALPTVPTKQPVWECNSC